MLLLLFGSGAVVPVIPPVIVGGFPMLDYIPPVNKEDEEIMLLWAFLRKMME
jgi:hypothetical protein